MGLACMLLILTIYYSYGGSATKALNTYQGAPNAANLAAAVAAVQSLSAQIILNPRDRCCVYDDMVNKLLLAVQSGFRRKLCLKFIFTAFFSRQQFFPTRCLDLNYVYVADPAKGVIYQFAKNSTAAPAVITP